MRQQPVWGTCFWAQKLQILTIILNYLDLFEQHKFNLNDIFKPDAWFQEPTLVTSEEGNYPGDLE